MTLRLPIGIDDFRKLREGGLTYVDKTRLVCDVIDLAGLEVLLLPRPRRFGKSLNLSMLRCFFERSDEDLSHLFEGLAVWRAGEPYRAHFRRYPVIHVNFKDVKPDDFEACRVRLHKTIQVLFDAHRHVLEHSGVSEPEARDYRAVLEGTAASRLRPRAYRERERGPRPEDLSRRAACLTLERTGWYARSDWKLRCSSSIPAPPTGTVTASSWDDATSP